MHKILFYAENNQRGGAIQYLLDMCQIAISNQSKAYVVANFGAIAIEDQTAFEAIGVQCLSVRILSWNEIRKAIPLSHIFVIKLVLRAVFLAFCPLIWLYQMILFARVLADNNPDLVVCAQGGYPAGGSGLRMLLVAAFTGVKSMMSVVASVSPYRGDQRRLIFWDRVLAKRVGKVIVNTENIKSELLAHGYRKIVVLHNGLEGCVDYAPRTGVRKKILFFARLEKNKGLETFLAAVDMLPSALLDHCEVHICGDGSLFPLVKNWAAFKPKLARVHGFVQNNFEEYFGSAHIYVLPSLLEGLPYTVLEAMRCGCPTIATPVGGIPELIESEKSGLLIPVGDAKALAKALENLLQDPNLCEAMGRASKAKFDHNFERSKIFAKNRNLFREIE
jgi:glycosyltransferase involved in cell wall biosynthesis